MVYLPRHESHRKKKSKAPIILILLFLGLVGLGITQYREIRLFFAKDQRQKLEKQKGKIINSLDKNELTDVYVRDFQTYSVDYLDKEPLEASAFHFRARAHYYELLLTGVRFDSSSLVSNLTNPIKTIFGDNQKTVSDLKEMFEYARKAQATNPDFHESASNQFLLMLGELVREVKKPQSIYKDYAGIKLENIDVELQHPYVWLLFYTTIRNGNQKDLENLLLENAKDDFKGKLLFTEREENYLKGNCYFHAKDYVSALNSLRQVKTSTPDIITKNAILTEAKIFYAQNLPQKAVDLLSDSYENFGKSHKEFLPLLKTWSGLRPDLKIKITFEEEPQEINDEID
ncbi:hypothetical protein [Leptospira sp. GIMC2001]|uniref:hypothetical protein n=1 Tax=Leptospira sp. GIMC2001 TaxID=1513297 RepID=UPI00234AD898|nr:hypothetical protein [Leptospira sp. GIMC2001]WCL49137.1 hypothetical protein O4O04_17875 [Leptospira sp. GIMC2001]